jgi:putative transcriptional regulator
MEVGQEIMVTTSRDVLADIAVGSGPEKYIVALGYAGWGGGQLENEMLANAWLSVSADTDIVFDMPLPSRFDEALGRLGIKIDRLHSEAGHA